MKAKAVGMRKLSSPDVVATALNTLKGRARIKRTMWSRRAQEYEAKINSGDLVSIAEVVRDLHRATGQPEQSYSERQLYEAALARMAREVAAIERIDEPSAVKRVEERAGQEGGLAHFAFEIDATARRQLRAVCFSRGPQPCGYSSTSIAAGVVMVISGPL